MDRHKHGFISFRELCLFTMKHICNPEDFTHYHAEEIEGDGEFTGGNSGEVKYVSALEAVLAAEEAALLADEPDNVETKEEPILSSTSENKRVFT